MRIGLTGGIASGKSSVGEVLEEEGVPVVDADLVSRAVMQPGSLLFHRIVEAFGPEVLNQAGDDLDRAVLGARVFGDPEARARLNELTHPAIWAEIQRQVEELEGSHPLVVAMIPLLLENGRHDWVDEVWVVALDPATQKARLMTRNGLSEAEAQERIDAQMPLPAKIRLAHRVIDNSGTREETRFQVKAALTQARSRL